MLRPEQLDVQALATGEDRGGAGSGVSGRVEQCRYYGHDALLQIRAGQAPADELLLARVTGAQALPAGTPVRVRARGPVTPLA
jgi:hypothetical protein